MHNNDEPFAHGHNTETVLMILYVNIEERRVPRVLTV